MLGAGDAIALVGVTVSFAAVIIAWLKANSAPEASTNHGTCPIHGTLESTITDLKKGQDDIYELIRKNTEDETKWRLEVTRMLAVKTIGG